MSFNRTMVIVVGDNPEHIESARKQWQGQPQVQFQSFSPLQWRDGLSNTHFRDQLTVGLPSLSFGASPVNPLVPNTGTSGGPASPMGGSPTSSNVLPFPGNVPGYNTGAAYPQTGNPGAMYPSPMGQPGMPASQDPNQFATAYPGIVPTAGNIPNVQTMEQLECRAIENAILQYRGNLTEAAKALGIGRATLYRRVKYFNIDPNFARKRKAA